MIRHCPFRIAAAPIFLGLFLAWVSAAAPASSPAAGADTPAYNPPPGPYGNLSPADFEASHTFASTDRLVSTTYFYWYDVFQGTHIFNADGSDALTDHPPTLTGFSYRSSAWHRTQLEDMIAAGIDIVLPVYWGAPSELIPNQPLERQPWSYSGLTPLVAAREELVARGLTPPRIGLFYDTSTLQHNAWNRHVDLTTGEGRRWFYESVRDFFSIIPPEHWAMIDGQPLVFLYSAGFAARHDQTCIESLRAEFARDFGGRTPHVVREISWNVATEQVYAWGGALGLKNPGVASLGPGYDHSAVPGRDPLKVDREDGLFYGRQWERFLRRPSNLMTIETWNEFHEGTDVAASLEYGRRYIELTRQYVDLFKQGYVPPRPTGPYTGARCVSIELGDTNREAGLRQLDWADGVTIPANIGGRECRGVQPTVHGGRYVYVKIDDSFKWASRMDATAVIEYFDAEPGTLGIDFDGSAAGAPFQSAYSPGPRQIPLSGSRSWKTASFPLTDAVFENRQNGGADFRLSVTAREFYVEKIQLVRPGLVPCRFSPGTGFTLMAYGDPTRDHVIQASVDLENWTVLKRLRLTGCSQRVTDPNALSSVRRFYRLFR